MEEINKIFISNPMLIGLCVVLAVIAFISSILWLAFKDAKENETVFPLEFNREVTPEEWLKFDKKGEWRLVGSCWYSAIYELAVLFQNNEMLITKEPGLIPYQTMKGPFVRWIHLASDDLEGLKTIVNDRIEKRKL